MHDIKLPLKPDNRVQEPHKTAGNWYNQTARLQISQITLRYSWMGLRQVLRQVMDLRDERGILVSITYSHQLLRLCCTSLRITACTPPSSLGK